MDKRHEKILEKLEKFSSYGWAVAGFIRDLEQFGDIKTIIWNKPKTWQELNVVKVKIDSTKTDVVSIHTDSVFALIECIAHTQPDRFKVEKDIEELKKGNQISWITMMWAR